MNRSSFNTRVFILEGLNSVATSFFFYYLFFYLQARHGFGPMENLLVCALNGLVFAPFALVGGKFGQKHGYMTALALGSAIMCISLCVGAFLSSVTAILIAMCAWTIGMCFTWPNLEALCSDKLDPAKLPRSLGIYNVVWAGGSALAYFFGGAVAERFGWKCIFWVPASLHFIQFVYCVRLQPSWRAIVARPVTITGDLHEAHPQGRTFLKMAWIANPFAYIAINAVVPVIPQVAQKLQLSPKYAGFFCSIWFFSRMFTFVILALWSAWHYRFRYLIFSYVGMVLCFGAILTLHNLWAIVLVQILFGWCLGVIYYSSLYYSMHVGDTKGEHGGAHEAAIGAGIFGGPAIGAASLALFPHQSHSGVIGVALVLAIGFAALLFIRKKPIPQPPP